jgi:ADP-ribose pyrophosphatase YjhB (NUDIX family)
MTQVFRNVYTLSATRSDVIHEDVDSFDDIPDALVQKAHAVCMHEGKMLLVYLSRFNVWGLPGGTREGREPIEQTLAREVLEEANCEILSFRPISSQKIVSPEKPDDTLAIHLQYLCDVKPLGDFKTDPAGNVKKILWIDPAEHQKYTEKKEFREAVITRAIEVLRSQRSC